MNDCLPQVHACAIRVARLAANGAPLVGAQNLYVSDALSILTTTPVYTDGDEIEEKNACGNVAINYRGDDSFKRLDVALTLVTPDPELHEMLASGSEVLTDGAAVGWAYPPIGSVGGNGVSIELWSKRIDDGDLDATFPYAWWVYPKVKNLRVGERAHQNGPLLAPLAGQAYENPNWFDGPLNDWPATSDRVGQWIPTAALPDVVCGYQALVAS